MDVGMVGSPGDGGDGGRRGDNFTGGGQLKGVMLLQKLSAEFLVRVKTIFRVFLNPRIGYNLIVFVFLSILTLKIVRQKKGSFFPQKHFF